MRAKKLDYTMYYYHVTEVENVDSILKNGLKADEEGLIYVYDTYSVDLEGVDIFLSDIITLGQLGYKKYAVIKVNAEPYRKYAKPDNVGELCASYHRILKVKIIKPEDIELLEIRDTDITSYGYFIQYILRKRFA